LFLFDEYIYLVESLEEKDADEVNRYWTYKSERSFATVLESIQKRPSACIRSLQTSKSVVDEKRKEETHVEKRSLLSWGLVRAGLFEFFFDISKFSFDQSNKKRE
jgi:hypothetical protein